VETAEKGTGVLAFAIMKLSFAMISKTRMYQILFMCTSTDLDSTRIR
jgi:hypothetical protein